MGIFDLSVSVTANEINEYFKVIRKAVSLISPTLGEKIEHVGHGMVRLATGKMSSRTGEVISALEFIGEVRSAVEDKMEISGSEGDRELAESIAVGAIKYGTLKNTIYQDSVFDKDQALSFEGDSGPYLMYTHARITSLLGKAMSEDIKPSTEKAPERPYEVEKMLYRFPEIVEKALTARDPHYVAHYLNALASLFNNFYAHEKIVDKSDELAPYKLALADAVKTTLKNGLWILGIKAPEKM